MTLRWEIAPAREAAVRAGLAAALEAGALPPGAVAVKESTVRTVHRLDLPGAGTVYVKRERPRDLAERAKFLFFRSRPRAEWENLRRLREAGLPVPEPIACAERRRCGALDEAVLVTGAIGPAAGLRERLTAGTIGAAGALARRLHDLGWFHRDYHAGNILVREGGALALVDLQKARHLPAVPARFRARDLAVFLHDLSDEIDGGLREAFLAAYGADAALRAAVERATAARRAERIASRSKRCVVRSTGFRIEPRGDLRIYRRADVPLEGVLAAVEAHARAVAAGEGAPGLVKLDLPTTAISRQGPIARDGPGAGPVAVKEFPARGIAAGLESLVRRHRGRQAWLSAHALLVRGIDTPLPLALVEVRRLGLVVGSYFISSWLEPAEDAHLYVDRRFAGGRDTAPPGRARGPWGEGGPRAPLGLRGEREAVRAFARFVANLHAEGVYHGDLKLPNFLVVDARPPRFALLDLDAVRPGGLSERRRAKNLAQIEDYARYYLPQIKRTHRAAFLREYGEELARRRERVGDALGGGAADHALAALAERHVQERIARREEVKARHARAGRKFHDR